MTSETGTMIKIYHNRFVLHNIFFLVERMFIILLLLTITIIIIIIIIIIFITIIIIFITINICIHVSTKKHIIALGEC